MWSRAVARNIANMNRVGEQALELSERTDTRRFGAHWGAFLPALIVGGIYAGLWLLLVLLGKGDGGLARLCLLVALVGTPILFALAFLRYASFALLIGARSLWFRQGWLRPRWCRLGLDQIRDVGVAQSPAGRILGSGAIDLTCRDGRYIRISDVRGPKAAAAIIRNRAPDT